MRLLLLVLLMLAWAILPAAASAAAPAPADAPEPIVNLNLRDVPLREALRLLFRGTGRRYEIDGGVPDRAVSVAIEKVPLDEAVERLVRAAEPGSPGLQVVRTDDGYRFTAPSSGLPAPTRTAAVPRLPDAARALPVTLELNACPLREAVKLLFAGTGLRYAVAPDIADQPVIVYGADLDHQTALEAVVRAAQFALPHLKVELVEDTYRFRTDPAVTAPEISIRSDTYGIGPDERISRSYHEEPLRKALADIGHAARIALVLDATMPDVLVTVELKNLRRFDALRAVAADAAQRMPGVDYGLIREDWNELWVVGMRQKPVHGYVIRGADGVEGAPQVTGALIGVPFSEFVRMLFAATQTQYVIDPDVPEVPVTIDFRDIPPTTALRMVIRQLRDTVPGLTYRRDGGVYGIDIRHSVPAPANATSPPPPRKHITLKLSDVPLRDALRLALEGTGYTFTVAADVPDVLVMLNATDMLPSAAVRIIARIAKSYFPDVVLTRRGAAYSLRRRTVPAPE